MSMFFVMAFMIGYIALTIYLANQVEATKQIAAAKHAEEGRVTIYDPGVRRQIGFVNALLYMGVFFIALFALLLVWIASGVETVDEGTLTISAGSAAFGVGLSLGAAGLAYALIASQKARERLQALIGHRGFYRPESLVHTTAIVLTLFVVVYQIVTFMVFGTSEEIDSQSVLYQLTLELFAAFLGVGWMIRRDTAQTLERLGLRLPPTGEDWRHGVASGFVLIGAMFIFLFLMLALDAVLGRSTQEADSTSQAYTSFSLALTVAFSAAVGEEILFRGALQPVFGNLLVSLVFAVLHTQAILGPGVIFLFAVSYLLGQLRQKYSTSAAIIAHFVYDIVLLSLGLLLSAGG